MKLLLRFTLFLFFFISSRVMDASAQEAVPLASPEAAAAVEVNQPVQAAAPVETKVLEIKQMETDSKQFSFELREADLGDLFRVLAHDYKLNLLVDKDVVGKVTASFSAISLEEALAEIAESQGLSIEKKNNVTRIRLNLITKIFTLKYIEASKLLAKPEASSSVEGGAADTAAGGQSPQQASTLFDLLSPRGKVLLGNVPNSIMVIDYPRSLERVEAFIKEIDKKMTKRVFKIKYLKASELMGETSASSGSAGASAASAGAAATATETAPAP